MAIPETMGERIQAAFDRLGLLQSDAAERLEVSRNTIVLWVNGAEIPERQLARIADLVGESPAWLRYGVKDAREEGIERYVTGYERALEDAREAVGGALNRLQPPPLEAKPVADAKPPREMRSGEEAQDPLDDDGPERRKGDRRA